MALSLAGTDEGVSIDGAVTVTKNQSVLTGCIWFRQQIAITGDIKLIDYSTFNTVNSRFTVQFFSGTPGQFGVAGRATDAEGLHRFDSGVTPGVGGWHHIVAVLDYANSTGTIYFDGEFVTTGTVSGGAFAAAQTANTNSENSSGSGGGIGVRVNATQGFTGLIEDMRLYNRALSASEAATIYAALGADGIVDGLLHRYPLVQGVPDGSIGAVLGGGLGTGTPCLSEVERIMGTSMAGSPVFAAGIIRGERMRRKQPTGRR